MPKNFLFKQRLEYKTEKRPKFIEEEEIESSPEPPQTLHSKRIVISGVMRSINRDALEQVITEKGGKVAGSVSKKTDILIVGDYLEDNRPVEQGRKYKNAQQYGVLILNELQFQEFIQKMTNDPNFKLGDGTAGKIVGPNCELISQNADHEDENNMTKDTVSNEELEAVIQSENQVEAFLSKKDKNQNNRNNKFKNPSQEITKKLNSDPRDWMTKYAPKTSKEIIGNMSKVMDLKKWLNDWDDVIINGNKKKIKPQKGQGWNNVPRINSSACLIGGPPGIGKTTSAHIICKELGYKVLSINASDKRSKKVIDDLLITPSTNTNIQYFQKLHHDENEKDKTVIIMDEVDGVNANDRGGIKSLIDVIKKTRTPIL